MEDIISKEIQNLEKKLRANCNSCMENSDFVFIGVSYDLITEKAREMGKLFFEKHGMSLILYQCGSCNTSLSLKTLLESGYKKQ